MERAPRFSTRQVTKRPFKRLGTSNASTKEESTESARNVKALSSPQKKNNKSVNDSPLKQTPPRKDHNDNQRENQENDMIESLLHTPVKLRRLNEDDLTLPGDVSVTFLASTPKPGRPQLSRRRPLSSVSESIAVPQSTSKSFENSTRTNDNSTQRVKSSVPKTSFKSLKQDVNAGRSLNDKIKKISQSTLEKKRHERRTSPHKMRSFSSSVTSVSKNSEAVSSSTRSGRSGSQSIRDDTSLDRSKSRHAANISGSKSKNNKQVQNKSVTHDKSLKGTKNIYGDKSTLSTGKTAKVASSNRNKNIQNVASASSKLNSAKQSSSKRKADISTPDSSNVRSKIGKTLQRKKNVSSSSNISEGHSRTTVKGKTSTSKSVDQKTQKNKNTERMSSSSEDESSLNRRRASTSSLKSPPAVTTSYSRKNINKSNQRDVTSGDSIGRQNHTTANAMKDQTVMLWQTDETKRTKRDVMDLDLVLSTVVENLKYSQDVYDLPDEQASVKRLKKYIVTDITKMIQSAQTVTNLQSRIKLSKQSIKQKQKKLMGLQKEKTELEEKCLPEKEFRETNEKMNEINDFISSLKSIVSQC
ncbi:hypothetical protein ACF0H5_000441 [Mactra antiquata]